MVGKVRGKNVGLKVGILPVYILASVQPPQYIARTKTGLLCRGFLGIL